MVEKEIQIKDKSRVSNYGEVLTSKKEVLDMLNLVKNIDGEPFALTLKAFNL